jgi:hypothetical protein
MKIRLISLLLVLSLTAWAQTPAPETTTQEKPASTEKAGKSCCHGMKEHGKNEMSCCKHDVKADGKEGMSCCKHEGKEMSCCEGKDGKMACMKGDKDKSAACCGGDSACCKDGKGCCGEAKDGAKTSKNCCGDKCERHAHAGAM